MPIRGDIQKRSFLNTNPFVAGWGLTNEKNGTYPKVLQHVQVPVVQNVECKKVFQRQKMLFDESVQFKEGQLCAGVKAGGMDACQGDSGGPMMLPIHGNGEFPFYQIGIVSYGDGCGRPNSPTIYTNVQHYADWIEEKLSLNDRKKIRKLQFY